MNVYKIRVGKNGRITLPIEVRRKLDLHTGDVLILDIYEESILLRKATPEEREDTERRNALKPKGD